MSQPKRKILKQSVKYVVSVLLVTLLLFFIDTNFDFGKAPGLSAADNSLINSQTIVPEEELTLSTPKRLIFPSIDLALPVIDSIVSMQTNEWPLTTDKAHYANFSSRLGERDGTVLIYGHRRWEALRLTEDMKIGDKLFIQDDLGVRWEFVLEDSELVTPDQTDFIFEETPLRVVIFTCDGWNNEFRRLMYFKPVEVGSLQT